MHGVRFWAVASDCAGAVRVDIARGLPFLASLCEGELHGSQDATALRVGVEGVVGVGGAPDAGYPGVRLGASPFDGLGALQYEGRGALADDEARVVLVVGAAGALGVGVVAAHGAHGDKASHDDRDDGRLGGAADHHIGVAAADQVVPEPDGVRTAGAGQGRRGRRALHTELDADVGGRRVRHDLGDRERVDPSRSLLVHRPLGILYARHPADPAPQYEPDPLRIILQLPPGARVFEGELDGGEPELGEAIRTLGRLAVHKVFGLEVRALGGDLDLKTLGVEERYGADPALVGQKRTPKRLAAHSDGTDHPYPGDVTCAVFAPVLHLALRHVASSSLLVSRLVSVHLSTPAPTTTSPGGIQTTKRSSCRPRLLLRRALLSGAASPRPCASGRACGTRDPPG